MVLTCRRWSLAVMSASDGSPAVGTAAAVKGILTLEGRFAADTT
jgi:hypothetical protein